MIKFAPITSKMPSAERFLFIGAIILFFTIAWIISIRLFLLMHFEGYVQNVNYDIQGFPTVTINEKDYGLTSHDWDISIIIEQRDKLIKRRGDMHLLLIKYKTKDTIDLLMQKDNPATEKIK